METVFFARFSQPFREFMFSHFEPERPTNMISLDSCIFACFMTHTQIYTVHQFSGTVRERKNKIPDPWTPRVCLCYIVRILPGQEQPDFTMCRDYNLSCAFVLWFACFIACSKLFIYFRNRLDCVQFHCFVPSFICSERWSLVVLPTWWVLVRTFLPPLLSMWVYVSTLPCIELLLSAGAPFRSIRFGFVCHHTIYIIHKVDCIKTIEGK